jgi:hypothetical protein
MSSIIRVPTRKRIPKKKTWNLFVFTIQGNLILMLHAIINKLAENDLCNTTKKSSSVQYTKPTNIL